MEGIQQLLEFAMEVNQSGSLEEKRAFLKNLFEQFVDLAEEGPDDFVEQITTAIPIIIAKAMADARKKMEE